MSALPNGTVQKMSGKAAAASDDACTIWLGFWPASVRAKDVRLAFKAEEARRIDSISVRRTGRRFYCFVNFKSPATARDAANRLGEKAQVAGAKVTVSIRADYDYDRSALDDQDRSDAYARTSCDTAESTGRKDKNEKRTPSATSRQSSQEVRLDSADEFDSQDSDDDEWPEDDYEASLYVGGLRRDAKETDIYRALRSVEDEITQVILKRDKKDGSSYAYVYFYSYNAGRKAERIAKKDSTLRPSTVCLYKETETEEVEPKPKAKPEKSAKAPPTVLPNIWIGSLVPEVTERDVRKLFKKYADDIDSVFLSKVHARRGLRFAFVNFLTSAIAQDAYESIADARVHEKKVLRKLTLPSSSQRTSKSTNGTKSAGSSGAPSRKSSAEDSTGAKTPTKPKTKPTATVLPQTASPRSTSAGESIPIKYVGVIAIMKLDFTCHTGVSL